MRPTFARPLLPRVIPAAIAHTLFDVIVGTVVFLGLLLLFLLKAPGIEFYLNSRDHGYQLSIGTQVLLGKVPGIDLPIAYGPLVMYTSTLGLWFTHSLIGETILCSTGYALSVFLLYHLVSRYASKWLGLVAAGFGLLLQARFYKWYLWLIPMAILWMSHRYLNSPPTRRWRWLIAGGCILGIGWLFRPDFGTTNLMACLVFFGLVEASEPPRGPVRVLRALGLFFASFSIFPLAWLGYVVARLRHIRSLDLFREHRPGSAVDCQCDVAATAPDPEFDRRVLVDAALVSNSVRDSLATFKDPQTRRAVLVLALISLGRDGLPTSGHAPNGPPTSPPDNTSSDHMCVIDCFRSLQWGQRSGPPCTRKDVDSRGGGGLRGVAGRYRPEVVTLGTI